MSKLFCDNTRKIYLASCLYDCIEDANIRAVQKLLIENAADPNIIIPDRGIAPFHLAVGNGVEKTAVEMIKLLLGFGGDPNVRSDDKLTPVHIAAAWGRFDILKLLLKRGGDATLIDDQNKCALDYARDEDHTEIADYLEQFSVHYDLENVTINSGLLWAEYVPNESDKIKTKESSYVHQWCSQLANITQINSDLQEDAQNNELIIQKLRFDYSDENNSHQHFESPCTKQHTLDYKSSFNLDRNILSDSSTNVPQCLNKNYMNYSPKKTFASNNSQRSCIEEDVSNFVENITRESGVVTIPSDSSKTEIDLNLVYIINGSCKTSSSEYLSCDSKSMNLLEKNITRLEQIINHSITSDDSSSNHVANIRPSDNVYEVAEEYKYIDQEEDVALIERHILVNAKIEDAISVVASSQSSSKASSLPGSVIINYDTDTLRKELTLRGEPPGPITKTTKRVYLKKLKRLKSYAPKIVPVEQVSKRVYSVELEKTLRNRNWSSDLSIYKVLEQTVIDQFSNPDPSKRWREGVTKSSFTYLLLDPRITNNLPNRSDALDVEEQWQNFLSAIFYVGKGKRSRPYSHLYEAVAYWQKGKRFHNSKKCEYILDIWKDHFGVVCLHIFQNIIPVEAYTREAAMIQAIKLQNLCNCKSGDFYGKSATWPERQKRQLGVFLLYRAMLIFLNEGERQLRPDDIEK